MEEEAEKKVSKKSFWQKFGFIAAIVLLVTSIAACSIIIFQKFYYTPFWVNGQSMYPTLNKDAKYADGTLIGEVRTQGEQEGIYDVDYGFMDSHAHKINSIKRFDIIICKYDARYASYNIKRVIALPGETFYITSSEIPEENGKLYVKSSSESEFKYIEQSISLELVQSGYYPDIYTVPTALKDNEYFVMGDNRPADNSYDSRNVGPVIKSNILGVGVGLNGKAKVGYDKDGIYSPIKVDYCWPKFF